MRCCTAAAVLLLTGCDARLAPGGAADGSVVDGAATIDAGADAPIDARACAGGTMAQLAPDGSCLVFVATPATYVDAKAACAAMTAHLAYLEDAALDTFAESFVGTANTWIGASDLVTEGTFVWEDGTPLQFTNWHTGEPNSGGPDATYEEDCVIVAGERIGKQWDDRPCDASEFPDSGSYAYLCQY